MPVYRIPKETKEQILARVKEGVPVPQLADEHGVSTRSIYGWLRRQAGDNPGSLTIGKLKRERDDLLKIIGNLTLELAKLKEKRNH